MSLINAKLSNLQPGSHVRLTHVSGQIIEGIIAENDGQESLSIQITSLSTLRYDQISMMDECQQAGSFITNVDAAPNRIISDQPVLSQQTVEKNAADLSGDKTIEVMRVGCGKDAVSKVFKEMENEEKGALKQAYGKYQSYLQSHEEEKYSESIDLIWDVIEKNEWDYNSRVNCFLGLIQLSHGDFGLAADSLYYAEDCRAAYCAAYEGADTKSDEKLYQAAAAFAAIYLVSGETENISEAVEVLFKSSEKSGDISGIEYVLKHSSSADVKAAVSDALRVLGANCVNSSAELTDVHALVDKMRSFYSNTEVEKEIMDYSGKNPEPISSDVTSDADSSDKPEASPKPESSEPDTQKDYFGKIITYKFFSDKGTIESDSGETYAFGTKDITDESLRKQVKNITTTKGFDPIGVKFSITKLAGKYVAVSIRRGPAVPKKPEAPQGPAVAHNSVAMANRLFLHKNYSDAIEIYRKHLSEADWEESFSQIVMCYLALSNESDGIGYLEELTAFVDKYVAKTTKNAKTLEALNQYYMKVHNYAKAVDVLNDLMELCDPSEHGRILHYLMSKARCYRFLQDYPSAVSQLLDWLDIVKRNKMKERNQIRDSLVYIELAEIYYENEDYEEAEKYAGLAAFNERKQALTQKLAEKKMESAADNEQLYEDEDEDEDDGLCETSSESEESLQNAYDSYTDSYGFKDLGVDDTTVVSTALHFSHEHLYCLLTYLNQAARLSAKTPVLRKTESGDTIDVGHVIGLADKAFAYAFNSPFLENAYISSEILPVFNEVRSIIPDSAVQLFAASALYSLFNTPSVPDYNISDFSVVAEEYGLERYTALLPLINDLQSFREKTGYGMDAFADYKTSSTVIDGIIKEAKACCTAADKRNDVFESQGQVRRLREYLFSGEDSELRTCLNIVAENNTQKYHFVRNTMAELFIRSNRPVTIDNLDIKKVDKYIDRFWDLARGVIQNEGRHIARPHDKIKGSKRNNVVLTIRRIISCICDWIAVAEHSTGTDNIFAKTTYDSIAPQVMNELSEVIRSCADMTAEKGFDWGTESIRHAAAELLQKMNGTYSNKPRKYFFVEFLRGEDVLLNDNYLPETESSFCGMPEFNILKRIERHASQSHPTFGQRLSEIMSNVENKHNFRSARLICAYGEDMKLEEITEHKDIAHYNECLKQAKQRFETVYQDFSEVLELYESYGILSNINGEKDGIMAIAGDWYRICRMTNDYGFYCRLLEVIRDRISINAEKKGERLLRQLDEIADKPEYSFGVFNKEMIEAKISDQNYTAAEYIMSCILRGDINAVTDYSSEPSGYFAEFISEHATNYRAVRGAGKDIADTIFEYSGKRDLEKALIYLTNNARKETKGGANLIKAWIPRGGPANAEQLVRLLSQLGFKPVSIQPDTSVDAEAYQVYCRKQIGKVNYVHPIPAFGSKSEQDGFRVLCLYGKYDCDNLLDKFRACNTTAKNTLVLLDFALNVEERRRLARKIKEEKSFAKTFVVIDRVILFYLAKHYAENTVIRRLMAVTLPFAYYQPFVESSTQNMPPELFTGREGELTQIESAEGANLVYGGRQLGKSALLKMAKHNIDKNGNGDRAVLIEEIKDHTAAESLKIVLDKLILEGILDESCRCDTWASLAGHIQKRLMDENPKTRINYLLLMLDEADEFIKTSDDIKDSPITALKGLPSERFKLVMAGLHNVSRYNRQMMHKNSNLVHLNSIVIRQFRREEATKLLTSILAYLGFQFNQKIIDNILASTYNYPGLIQFYCQKLLEAMKNDDYAGYKESLTPSYEVTESHYRKVLSDTDFTEMVNNKLEATLFTEEKGRSNYHIIALILAFLDYNMHDDKGYTVGDLLKVANEYKITRITALKAEQLDEILNEMWDLNVITVMDGYYRFATDGFRKLLGSKENVDKSMADYIEEVDLT